MPRVVIKAIANAILFDPVATASRSGNFSMLKSQVDSGYFIRATVERRTVCRVAKRHLFVAPLQAALAGFYAGALWVWAWLCALLTLKLLNIGTWKTVTANQRFVVIFRLPVTPNVTVWNVPTLLVVGFEVIIVGCIVGPS